MTATQRTQLPGPGMEIDPTNTALVVTDPQNDFLSLVGVAWGVIGKTVDTNGTVEHIETLFKLAKANDIPVFISPHYYYPSDHGWKFEGALETLMHKIGMFDRPGPLDLEGSGADWLERYKPYIEDGATVVTNPHKAYGPENNDLVSSCENAASVASSWGACRPTSASRRTCGSSFEQGFEVAVVADATAAGQVPEGDGYEAALVNLLFLASAVWTTDDVAQKLGATVAA